MNIGIYDHDIFYAQNLAHKLSVTCPQNIHFDSHSLEDIQQTIDAYDMIITEKIFPQSKKPQIKLNKYLQPCTYGKEKEESKNYVYYRFGEPGLLAEYIINHEKTRHQCLLHGNKLQMIYLPFAQSPQEIWKALVQVKNRSESKDNLVIPLYPHHLIHLENHQQNHAFLQKKSLSSLLVDLMNHDKVDFDSAFYPLGENLMALGEIERTADLFPTETKIWERFIEKLLLYQNQKENTNLICIIAQMPLHYFKSLFQKADEVFLVNNSQEQSKITESIFRHLDIHLTKNMIHLGADDGNGF